MTYKSGDRLAYWSGDRWGIRRIDRITPSGRLVIGTTTLNPDLSIRGAPMWSRAHFEPLSDRVIAELEIQRALDVLRNANFRLLPRDVILSLARTVKEATDEGRD